MTCFEGEGFCIDWILANRKNCFTLEIGFTDQHHMIYSTHKNCIVKTDYISESMFLSCHIRVSERLYTI